MVRSASKHTVHSGWTRNIVALAAAAGADADALWDAGNLDPDALGDLVPDQSHMQVWEAIMRTLRSPAFPIRVASQRSIDEYALLGLASKTSRNVGEAIEHLMRFLTIWTSQFRCELVVRDESADLMLHGPSGGLGRRCSNESAVAQIVKAIREISRVPVDPQRACFRHEAPDDIGAHERFFRCPVEFGAGFDGVELATSTLDAELALADDGLSSYLVGQLANLAAEAATDQPLTAKVRNAISALLPSGPPKLEAVATKLAMTPRTLQRQLAAADTSFADLTDQTRHDLAVQLLRDTERSVAEISFVLGFSEPSAFHRAFKRWTGATPTAFRTG